MSRKFGSAEMILVLIGIFLIAIAFPDARIIVLGQVGTSVGGYISENTIWTIDGSPYIVEESVIVEPSVALSIEPGVEVRFVNETELIIDGSLTASGNAANYITFTSNATTPKPGDWEAINFRETSDDASCIINWTIIEYASTGVLAYGSSPTIENSIIEYNSYFGIMASSLFLIGDHGNPLIQNCTIMNNGGAPDGGDNQGGTLTDGGSHMDIKNSLIENNIGYGVRAKAGGSTTVVGSVVRNSTGTGVKGDVMILRSEITGNNQSGISVTGEIHYNSIFGNTPYDLAADSDNEVDASYNWWGTTNETLIQESIYDYYDDFNLGKVTYKPYISSPYFVYHDEQIYEIGILSNSSITDFDFIQSEKSISFSVNGTTGTFGFCNITVPAELMWGDFSLCIDDIQLVKDVDYTEVYNGTHYSFSISYEHSSHKVDIISTNVIPDFSGWLFLPFIILATLSTLLIRKRFKKLTDPSENAE